MLEIDVAQEESFDESTEKFVVSKRFRVALEHSLVSMSKWESVWEEPFLGDKDKTSEQTISYVKMMLLTSDVPPEVFQKLLSKHIDQIKNYISAKMTATTITETPGSKSYREIVTSELVYYWMFSMSIPMECEHWHLNRLITLIRVFGAKNAPKRKMSMADRRALNKQRQAKYNTRG